MKLVFYLLFSCLGIVASAQRVYFIYLQTEDNAPFYIKMGDKIYSASSGYLIIPNLVDSTYSFSAGFPSVKSESKFSVRIAGKDRGFLLKNFDYGLGLFDLQTLSVIRSQTDESKKSTSYRSRNDDFTALLAKASNDSSLFLAPILVKQDVAIQKTEQKKEDVQPKEEPVKRETASINPPVVIESVTNPPQNDVAVDNKKTDPPPVNGDEGKNKAVDSIAAVNTTEPKPPDSVSITQSGGNSPVPEVYKRSVVKKHSESSTSEGFGLVFYDNYEGGADTIQLLIPNPKVAFKPVEKAEPEGKDQQLIELKQDTLQAPPIVVANKGRVISKTACKSTASDNDFFKLRKAMAGRSSDEAMVNEAKKVFKSKCFTTEQIRNLGSLFLTSAGKYQFFDAAYLHVTDQEQFSSLQTEIKDDYYLKRFKAMVGE